MLALSLLAGIAGVLTVADRPSWSLLFVFTAIAGAMRLSRRDAALWIVFCTCLTAATLIAAQSDAAATISFTATTLAIGFMMFAFRRLMQLNQDLVEAREELARMAVSEERAHFARDLLGHSLSVIAVKAELAERLLARDPSRAAEHVADLKTGARDALGEVRDAVSGYRQPTLSSELEGARMGSKRSWRPPTWSSPPTSRPCSPGPCARGRRTSCATAARAAAGSWSAQVGRGDEVLAAAHASRADVALLDIEMPGASGLEVLARLAAQQPDCRILILTTFGRPGYLRRAMEGGAAGFLLKDAPIAELASAIRRAMAGERIVDPGLAAAALSEGASPLTAREQEVLLASREHATVAQVASALHLSPGTARNHLSAIMGKLGAHSRIEALRIAGEKGWL
jgi:two-component system, NarL family, response regulator DesR